MSSDSLVARLEQVTKRLEMFADRVATGAPSSKAAVAEQKEKVTSPIVMDWDAFVTKFLTPIAAATADIKDTGVIATNLQACCKCIRDTIEASTECKKPSDKDFQAFIAPLNELKQKMDDAADKKNPNFNFFKALSEASVAFYWPTTTVPKVAIESGLEPADVYFNKILIAAKNITDKKVQDAHRLFVRSFKAFLTNMITFALEHCKCGLDWNFKGVSLSSFKPGGSSEEKKSSMLEAAPEAPEAPAPPPVPEITEISANTAASNTTASAPSGGLGMSAVFASINSGSDGITKGLRKVKDTEKCKNMKEAPSLKPKEKEKEEKKKSKFEEKQKPPKYWIQGDNAVFLENFNHQDKEITEVEHPEEGKKTVEMKHMIYISRCNNMTVTVPTKVKSIQIDKCNKLTLHFTAVVSSCEVVNSDDVHVHCSEQCPSFVIDKSAIVFVHQSEKVAASETHIYTSNSHTITLVVPSIKSKDKEDVVEIPLPYQFESTYNSKTGKVKTEAVAHSAA
eukprot:TRINITY_DN8918_c0_g1_i1.p1 TRINITY_DN8918_c0_g1~~TRINITY_DN8918_c0_g1_i1.p1  ORF type:complete len:509 (+),score=180.91 TRINITY_DN8918_c0_g1_i1:47-1573(+)